MNDEPRRYPRPSDLALGLPVPDGWEPDGVVMRRGIAHEVCIVKEEGDELLVSGLTFSGWIRNDQLIRPAD